MNIYTIIGIAFSLALVGIGIGVGLRLLNLERRTRTKARRQLGDANSAERESRAEVADLRRRLSQPKGARRTTSIHGVNGLGYLRHTDGSYAKAYYVEMPATLYGDDVAVDRIYNDWARMLQSLKLQGCIVQVRHDVWPDSGRALHSHIKAQAHTKDTFMPARMLHTVGLTGTESAVQAGQYQDDHLTLWVRVPVRHANDPSRARLSRILSFFPALARDLRANGIASLMRATAASWTRTNVERLCARSRADEEAACERASQVFASIEHMCPLELRAFTREEMWRETYLSHRLNERTAPKLANVEGADLRQHLCCEEITSGGQFLMHGDHPVAIVSLFRPPTPVISAGMLRVMTANPNLVFRHTTVVEFITLDQEKAKAHLRDQYKDANQ